MIIAVLALFGVIFGSFVNALVWRLHEQSALKHQKGKAKGQGKRAKQTVPATLDPKDLSIMKGRSMCPNCHHTLAADDLVPVLSWVRLGGRCRYCHQPISWQYPLVELLTGGLFVLSYLAWPLDIHGVGLFQLVVWLVFAVAFMALAVYDLRWFLLPDKVVFPLIGLAAVQVVVVAVWSHSWGALWEPAVGGLIIFGLFWTLYQVSKGAWIGGGDVKLALVLGLLAGTPLKAFLVIFLASLVGTVASVPVLARGSRGLKVHIPFGPYLLLATVLTVLYGSRIISWYTGLVW